MRFFITFVLVVVLFPSVVISQDHIELAATSEANWINSLNSPKQQTGTPRLDLRPKGKDGNWQEMIDEVWGYSLTGEEQWEVFSGWVNTLDAEFACFVNHDVDLASFSSQYQAELQAGVSRGRFQGILDQVNMAIQNGHTRLRINYVVNANPQPGIPLLIGYHSGLDDHFGACLTTGDDGVFVYEVVDDHPLGLEVGDVILGYDGESWSELYPYLIAEELPIGNQWLTSDASYEYGWEISVGDNWHLFETIDIRKFDSGEVQHLPTSLMVDCGVDLSTMCTDHVGTAIPHPSGPDHTTWGVLDHGDRRIGFIRCDAWTSDASTAWSQACLDMVNDPDLDGLIIDFRSNNGGGMQHSYIGINHLFNEHVPTVNFGIRDDPSDHLSMNRPWPSGGYDIEGNPANYFDKPIAVLLGPRTISAGDQVALRMTFHPMVRTFGRPTSATFDSPTSYMVPGHTGFTGRYSIADAGYVDQPSEYLSSTGFPVDQEVWLDPQDCRNGRDTILWEAIKWILPLSAVPEGAPAAGSHFTSVSPNPSNPHTIIKFQVETAGPCRLEIYDVAGRLVGSQQWSTLEAGPHDYLWNGKTDSGQSAASGIYMVRLTAPDMVDRTRFTLVR